MPYVQVSIFLIATPGRLLDLMNQRYVKLDHIKMLVLDEADRMLDMGFIHDVKKIIAKVPAKRQTIFFSATMPQEISMLANTILNESETCGSNSSGFNSQYHSASNLFCRERKQTQSCYIIFYKIRRLIPHWCLHVRSMVRIV
jgi:superfamily II DNA/RNA helicase